MSTVFKTLKQLESEGVKTVLIKTIETQYWREDIIERADEIYGYALVDLTKPTNLCSIQINFPYDMLYYRVRRADNFEEDELAEIENISSTDEGYYLEHENCQVVREWKDIEFEKVKDSLEGNPLN